MADTVQDAWRKVGDELSGLGLKLKLHAQQEMSDEHDDEGICDRLEDAIDGVIDAVENAATDAAVRQDLQETKRLLADALRTTYRQARANIASATHTD